MDTESPLPPLLRAAKIVGGQAALARRLGVRSPTVNQWIHGDRPVPAGRCPQIEQATAGAVRCEELRPDVAWDVLRGAPPVAEATERQAA